nr:Ty3/gypsy retrotransposon protein [Tanacetum cinerariifolium]
MKLRYAVIHLEGDAIQWHRAFMKTRGATVAELTWENYVRAISSRFSNAMFEDPMEEIASLIQDDDLHEYNNAFDALLNKEDKIPQISIHALTGLPSYSTMRIRGAMGNRQLHILVDSGSTHNFIDVKLAHKLQFSVKDIPSLNVGVAGGKQLQCNQMCLDFQWTMQGHWFTTEVDGKPCELKGIQTNVSLCSMEKVRMDPDDIHKTTFRTHEGHYDRDVEQHKQNLRHILSIMKEHQLFAKESKRIFGGRVVEYLGHIISGDGVRTDPSKVEAVQEWPLPKTLK